MNPTTDSQVTKEVVDFNQLLSGRKAPSVAYTACYIAAKQTHPGIRIRIGSDDQAKVYLNGKQVKVTLPVSQQLEASRKDYKRGTSNALAA